MNILRCIGRFKYRAMRMGGYVSLFNTVILITKLGWEWWYSFIFVVMILAYLFEKHHGIPGEQEVSWAAAKEWQEFKKDWDRFRGGN